MTYLPSQAGSTTPATFEMATEWDDGDGLLDARLVETRAPAVTIDSNSPGNLSATLDVTFAI